MAFRKTTRLVVCAAGLAAVFSGPLAAQQSEKDLVPADTEDLLNPVEAELTFNGLNLVAATYGNQLGVEVSDVDPALCMQLGIEEGTGVIVTGVSKESEAGKAGLQSYDLVVRIGEQKIAGTKSFHDVVGASPPEKAVEFHVVRKGKPATIRVTIPNRPLYEVVDPNVGHLRMSRLLLAYPNTTHALQTRNAIRFLSHALEGHELTIEEHYRIGVTLSEADDTLRSQLRLAAGEGLVVTEVHPEARQPRPASRRTTC